MSTPFLGLAVRIANTLDCLFTVLLFLTVGNVEANPIMGGLLAFSWPLFVIAKVVGVAVFTYILTEQEQRVPLIALACMFTIAAASNAALWMHA